MWPFTKPDVVRCGGCRGTGICSRCKGTGTAEFVQGDMVVVGSACNRCKDSSGICPGCNGSGWLGVKQLKK